VLTGSKGEALGVGVGMPKSTGPMTGSVGSSTPGRLSTDLGSGEIERDHVGAGDRPLLSALLLAGVRGRLERIGRQRGYRDRRDCEALKQWRRIASDDRYRQPHYQQGGNGGRDADRTR
jgi:hypothetical protein